MIAASLRRAVIVFVIALLVIGGAAAGVEAGALYADQHDHHSVASGVLVGLGTGVGSWFIAALVGLFLEIADSLRSLVERTVVS